MSMSMLRTDCRQAWRHPALVLALLAGLGQPLTPTHAQPGPAPRLSPEQAIAAILAPSAPTGGVEIGGDVRLSDMGPGGAPAYGAGNLAVTYTSIDNQYLVVWSGDDNTGGLVDGELEIFGQLMRVPSKLYLTLVVR